MDYAEFLDEALVECWELHESRAKGRDGEGEREWWILKPAMSDQGQGVRLFSSEEDLRAIFEEWEGEGDDDAGEDGETDNQGASGAATMTSQLRHFIAQKYIDPPLLLESYGNRKFHIRSYVLAVGALRTYVYKEMLALFAPEPYTSPTKAAIPSTTDIDQRIHLTNTCLQSGDREGSIIPFSSLTSQPSLSPGWKESIFAQIYAATGTLFEAAAREQMIHFQALENAFEVFGVDWLVDSNGVVYLLEVNAFPDFKASGEDGRKVVRGLWEGIVGVAVKRFFTGENEKTRKEDVGEAESLGMVKVLDIDLGRR